MLTVTAGDVTFHGFTDTGFLIGPDGFKGWEGATATRRDAPERPYAHGSFVAPAFKGVRLLTLTGWALAKNEGELTFLGDLLAGVGQERSRVTVTTEAGSRWADGDVEGPIEFDRIGGRTEATYEVSFLFPDPFKYGIAREFATTGSTVQAWHRGTATAWPTVTVSGYFPTGYGINHPDGWFRVRAPLDSGDVDVIDFRTGVVRRNGALLRTFVTDAERWGIPAGKAGGWSLRSSSTQASGRAVMRVTDTYA